MGIRIYLFLRKLMELFAKKETVCQVCVAHLSRIEDLKLEIARLVKEKENERAEYKRAIDVLLQEKQLPIIGQGVAEKQPPFNPSEMLSFMEKEVDAPPRTL